MRKSDFTNRPDLFGRSNYLIRELLALVEHAEKHPGSAEDLLAYWGINSSLVQGAISGAVPAPDPEPDPDPVDGGGDP